MYLPDVLKGEKLMKTIKEDQQQVLHYIEERNGKITYDGIKRKIRLFLYL